MSSAVKRLIQEIHRGPTRFVLAVSGGGSGAIGQLLEVPGASRTVLEAAVPYSAPAMVAWLGGRPDQACSEPTARAMAMAAYLRACRYGSDPGAHENEATSLAGVACTASLASDRPKRGPHRAHLAIQTRAMTLSQSVELEKGRRTRAEEEGVVARLVLNAVARACGVGLQLDPGLVEPEQLAQCEAIAPAAWQDLLAGRVEMVLASPATDHPSSATYPPSSATSHPRVVFPGAFNPRHVGHRRMAEIAGRRLQRPVEFEMPILNVDKPPLDFLELQRRAGQFGPGETLWLTRAATFEAKSQLAAGATFVVGADTLRRIADPRYYGGDSAACHRAIAAIAARSCRFLVFGRRDGDRFVGLSDLDLPSSLASLCDEVPADEFHEDVSSTEIRGNGGV
jgi:nicotinamide mononucleotide (NMN) deamidase PncC